MENQETKQENQEFSNEIKNEFLLELKELASRAPKGISLTVLAAENVTSESRPFEGLILATGSPKKILSIYENVFDNVPALKDIIFDAVAYHKLKSLGSKSPTSALFESIFGPSIFKR